MNNPTLYHTDASTCSQRARLALDEKGVEWTSREIDLVAGQHKAADYLAINPQGLIPSLEHDGNVILETTIINEYIDEVFDGPDLLPKTAAERAQCRLWPKYADENVHKAISVLIYATLIRNARKDMLESEVLAIINATEDEELKQSRRDTYLHGLDAPISILATKKSLAFLDEMEKALYEQDWLCGHHFSLAECSIIPYVARLGDFGLSDILWGNGVRPNVERWVNAVKARKSYATAIESWLPAIMPTLCEEASRDMIPHFQRVIAGESQRS